MLLLLTRTDGAAMYVPGVFIHFPFHVQSVKDVCSNLSPGQVNSIVMLSGMFAGQCYITWNVQVSV